MSFTIYYLRSKAARAKTLADRAPSALDRTRVNSNFLGAVGGIPSSQAICLSLLEQCFEISYEISANEESKNVASSLKPVYDRLTKIRSELENLLTTQRWSVRETDLQDYSLSLHEIDKMLADDKSVDPEGKRPSGQFVGNIAKV